MQGFHVDLIVSAKIAQMGHAKAILSRSKNKKKKEIILAIIWIEHIYRDFFRYQIAIYHLFNININQERDNHMAEFSEDLFNGEQIVEQLRHVCRNLGIQKPSEEILKSIRELIEKDGENHISMSELKKVMENALKELNERK